MMCEACIEPLNNDSAISFHTPNGAIDATVSNIHRGDRATVLAQKDAAISTVEHLLFALCFFPKGAVVHVRGPEIPILDGSALIFAKALYGWHAPKCRFFPVQSSFSIQQGDAIAHISPCPEDESPKYTVCLEFEGPEVYPPLRHMTYSVYPKNVNVLEELARARTFALQSEVEMIRAQGLGDGGSLQNAVVLGSQGPLNPEGLRFPNEPARHKMLDLIGDLFLLGALPYAHLDIKRPGHKLNHQLVKILQQHI